LSWGRPRGDEIAVSAGACLSQPAGMRHNVAFYSDDLELIEINIPADYATNER
jgi:mannose-6-phosphate isomerase-like protein (cupin superfamily)